MVFGTSESFGNICKILWFFLVMWRYTFRPHWHVQLDSTWKWKTYQSNHTRLCARIFGGVFLFFLSSFFPCCPPFQVFKYFCLAFHARWPCAASRWDRRAEERVHPFPASWPRTHRALPSYLLLEVSFPLKEFFFSLASQEGVWNQPTPSLWLGEPLAPPWGLQALD